jgi:hypothetical protein
VLEAKWSSKIRLTPFTISSAVDFLFGLQYLGEKAIERGHGGAEKRTRETKGDGRRNEMGEGGERRGDMREETRRDERGSRECRHVTAVRPCLSPSLSLSLSLFLLLCSSMYFVIPSRQMISTNSKRVTAKK